MKKMSQKVAASAIAASIFFAGGAVVKLADASAAAVSASKYQNDINTFAAHYAKILHKVESYKIKLDAAKSEKEADSIYGAYMNYLDNAIDDESDLLGLKHDLQKMDGYLYDTLVTIYNLEVDTINYLQKDLSKEEYKKASDKGVAFIAKQDSLFKKEANIYKAKHHISFSKDMKYLLDDETSGTPAEKNTYTVKKGDSLYQIAKKYHTTSAELKKLNSLKSDVLKIGQVLKVPVQTAPVKTYTVKKGDTLSAISKKVQVSVAALIKINSLKTDHLSIGQVLKLR
ncbi:LysM repeat-containing protein [Bacillus sp. OV322]|uniref:LysM peptidoglycan-binding domain-containing protein n=1 Tax=Bacillus sp. OV322 TaxID=1882764 RepID=UPI0008DFDD12|nr:LysM peptidoglycan-binding domain-containing protein [Bacillus sp. OV322]SFC80710.1 LysM repeat-containing protein [Bacillus sp. OV322]